MEEWIRYRLVTEDLVVREIDNTYDEISFVLRSLLCNGNHCGKEPVFLKKKSERLRRS